MDLQLFFSELLKLDYPFSLEAVKKIEFQGKIEQIELIVTVNSSYVPEDGSYVHSYYERTWRHLNLFEYPCFIRCRVPRYKHSDGKIGTLEVPWSRKGSGFTLLLERYIMALIKLTYNVEGVSRMLDLYPQRVWSVFHYYMDIYEKERDMIETVELGLDETSSRKGHEYVTVFIDIPSNEVIDVQEGKDSTVIERFVERYIHWDKIKSISMDMSPAFIKGVKEHLPHAQITFDKFHVVRLIYDKLDPRKKDDQWGIRTYLAELFENVWNQQTKPEAAALLQFWCDFAEEKGFNQLVKSIKKHFDGIIEYVHSKLNNGKLEGINNKIQLIKRTARGYKYPQNFRKMILLAFNNIKI